MTTPARGRSRYILTRPCLENGTLTILKYLERVLPAEGEITLVSDGGEETRVSIRDHKLNGLNDYYAKYHLGVNDQVYLTLITDRRYQIECVARPHEAAALTRAPLPQPPRRVIIEESPYVREVREVRSAMTFDAPLGATVEKPADKSAEGAPEPAPLVAKVASNPAQSIPLAFRAAENAAARVAQALGGGDAAKNVAQGLGGLTWSEPGLKGGFTRLPFTEPRSEAPEAPRRSNDAPRTNAPETSRRAATEAPATRPPTDLHQNGQADARETPSGDNAAQRVNPVAPGAGLPAAFGSATPALQTLGFSVQPVNDTTVLLVAALGARAYSVLMTLDPNDAALADLQRRHDARYMTQYVKKSERPGVTQLKVVPLHQEALERLVAITRLAPVGPLELEGYFNAGGLTLEAAESIESSATHETTARGAFSYTTLTLARYPRHAIISAAEVHKALEGTGISLAAVQECLETLSRPPFTALTRLANNEFNLRQTTETMLENLATYATTLKNRLGSRHNN